MRLEFYKTFCQYVSKHWLKMCLIFLLITISSATSLAFPLIIKIILDDILPNRNLGKLVSIVFLFLAVSIGGIGISILSNYMYALVGNHVMKAIRRDVFYHLVQLPLNFFDNNKTGDIVHRVNNEVSVIQQAITSSVLRFAYSALSLTIMTVILVFLNWKLFLISIVALPLFYANVRFFHPKIRNITLQGREKSSELLSFFMERFENIKIIKTLNRQVYERQNTVSHLNELISINLKNVLLSSTTSSISSVLASIAVLAVLGFGGYQVIVGAMTVGSLVAFLQYMSRLYDPFRELMSLYVDLVRASVSIKRVMEYLDIPIQSPNGELDCNFNESIYIKDVRFAYKDKLVLNDLNLSLEEGQRYALVGSSGCGKSTIAKLLLRFYDCQGGSIKVDEHDIQSIKLENLREQIGLVTQENQLFHDTIMENIRYGNLASDDDKVLKAAKAIGLNDQLEESGISLQAMIGDKGTKLSGGQKQRIALARLLLRNCQIIVLDEATSALDTQAEEKVLKTIYEYFDSRTFVVISHRLSTVKNVDKIFVMDSGKIIEEGSYDYLQQYGQHFRQLFREQIELMGA